MFYKKNFGQNIPIKASDDLPHGIINHLLSRAKLVDTGHTLRATEKNSHRNQTVSFRRNKPYNLSTYLKVRNILHESRVNFGCESHAYRAYTKTRELI